MVKVLLVDDDENVRYSLKRLLTRAGHDVTEAENGKKALAQMTSEIQIVVTDIVMPDMEGIGLLQELKKAYPDLPVVVISGGGRMGAKGYLETANVLGADATFMKPLDESAFLTSITDLTTPVADTD